MTPRQTAIQNGDMFYEGKPCKRGHTTKYSRSYSCIECTKQREYQYRLDNREELNQRRRKYQKKHRQEDPLYRMKKDLSRDVWTFHKERGSKKEGKTHELLGYTAKECNEHIESLFQEGMTWDNRNEWHIDHIIPQSYFTSIDQIRECYALSNLKPEWGEWNRSKGNRFIGSSEDYPMVKKVA